QRHHAEEALRASETRYRGLFENAAVGIAELTIDGVFVMANRCLEQMLGYGAGALAGRTFRDLIFPEDVAAEREQTERLIRGKIPSYTQDQRLVRADGHAVWTNVTCSRIFDERLNREFLIVIVMDISRRKEIEEELAHEHRQSELEKNRLRTMLEILPVGVFIADATGRLLDMNPAAQALWGGHAPLSRRPEEYSADYVAYWPETGERVLAEAWGLSRALRQGERVIGEEMIIEASDGTRRTILNYAVPIQSRSGGIVGGVAV